MNCSYRQRDYLDLTSNEAHAGLKGKSPKFWVGESTVRYSGEELRSERITLLL